MRVEHIHRWQWVIISLILGFLMGYVRNYFTEEVSDYKNSMNEQKQFESAIFTHERLPDGQVWPLFNKLMVFTIKDPTATPRSTDEMRTLLTPAQQKELNAFKKPSDQTAYLLELAREEAHNRRAYVIAGGYYNGRGPTWDNDKKIWVKKWQTYFYIAPNPYKPTRQFAIAGPVPAIKPTLSDKLQALAEKVRLKDPDPPDGALAYLKALKAQGRVEYTYEWWKAPRVAIATWMAGCLLVIGGIWPTAINLLVYGRLSRPYEEKVDLSKVRNTAMAAKASREPTAEELAQLKALEEELEAKLAASASSGPLSSSDQPAPEPVKALTAKELEVAAAAAKAGEGHEYAAKPDDFYPTEKRMHKDE